MALQLLILLFFALHQLLPLFIALAEQGLLLELVGFVSLAFSICYFFLQHLDLGPLILLVILATGRFGLEFVHFLLEVSNLINLLHSHADSATDVLSLLPDLIDLLLALLERLLLFMKRGLQHVILRLVLLFERAVVIVAHDFVQETLELALDLLEGIRIEAKLVNLLELFGFVGYESNVKIKVVFFCHVIFETLKRLRNIFSFSKLL